MSRQQLTALLAELVESALIPVRWQPNGKFASWPLRFGGAEDEAMSPDISWVAGDTDRSIIWGQAARLKSDIASNGEKMACLGCKGSWSVKRWAT